jgi:hypothetical protein
VEMRGNGRNYLHWPSLSPALCEVQVVNKDGMYLRFIP